MTPAERIERTQWDLSWAPPEAAVVDRPELAYITCPRPAPHLNSVYRSRIGPERVAPIVDEVRARTDHGVLRWMITDTWDAAPVQRGLEALGFAADHDGIACILDTGAWAAAPRVAAGPIATVQDLVDAESVLGAAFDRHWSTPPDGLAFLLAQCTDPAGRVRRFLARNADGTPLATGGMNLFPELSIGMLWGGATHPSARGRGAYTAVLDARIRAARAAGLRWVGLYAMEHTSAPIVLKEGFSAVGRMRYLVAPAA